MVGFAAKLGARDLPSPTHSGGTNLVKDISRSAQPFLWLVSSSEDDFIASCSGLTTGQRSKFCFYQPNVIRLWLRSSQFHQPTCFWKSGGDPVYKETTFEAAVQYLFSAISWMLDVCPILTNYIWEGVRKTIFVILELQFHHEGGLR